MDMMMPPEPEELEAMAEMSLSPSLLSLPTEIRLRIYEHLFIKSILKVCGYKHRRGHHLNELPDRGKRISIRQTPYQITHVCSKIRSESLPMLLENTLLSCCHMGSRLVDTHLPPIYREHLRSVSIDCLSFNTKFIHSLRPDVPHRRCKTLPCIPHLQTLIIRMGASFGLASGFKRENLNKTTRLGNGDTLLQHVLNHARTQLVQNSSSHLNQVLTNEHRGFNVEVRTYGGDFNPKTAGEEKGIAAVSPTIPFLQGS